MASPKRPSRSSRRTEFDAGGFVARRHAAVPHEFALEAIAALDPVTRPMFGCLAVYVQEKIVLILRDRPSVPQDNGVWIGTAIEHHPSLRTLFPHMRSVRVFGKAVTDWQVLPADAPDFERSVLAACALIRAGDPRIGRVPKRKGPARPTKSARSARSAGKRV